MQYLIPEGSAYGPYTTGSRNASNGGILIITTGNKNSLSARPQEVMVTLRERLRDLQVWPEAGDVFLELLPVSRWHSSPLTAEDYEWLPQVVVDAIDGIDIGSRYPAFFQKLVTSSNLGQSFLDELDRQLAGAN